jgi:hypothetical protein
VLIVRSVERIHYELFKSLPASQERTFYEEQASARKCVRVV